MSTSLDGFHELTSTLQEVHASMHNCINNNNFFFPGKSQSDGMLIHFYQGQWGLILCLTIVLVWIGGSYSW